MQRKRAISSWPGFFAGRTEVDRLNDVAREEQFNRPVAHHAHLAFESRELAQIKDAPEKPREKAAEFVTLYFRARGVLPDDADRADPLKTHKHSPLTLVPLA